MQGSLPLAGVRVVDLTRNVAGPYAAMILADLGADVTKVEQPGKGDDTRHWGPPFFAGEAPAFLELNRNKECLTLDLAAPEAGAILRRLVLESDVVLESFRPGALERLGFSYEWARGINSRLIYTSITSYGDRGPMRDRPGYDPLMQGYGGLMSITGEAGRPPVRVGTSIIDMGTGMWAAMATLAALYRRQATGAGEHIVTSLYETALAWVMIPLGNFWASGEVPGRFGSGTSIIVPYRAFPTTDGYLLISAGNDNLFRRLCGVLGQPGWADDPRFRTNPDRVTNRDAIDELIAAATRDWPSSLLEERLVTAGIPCGPIRSLDQVAADSQAAAVGMFQQLAGTDAASFPMVGLPMMFGGGRPPLRAPAPGLGEQNAAVLARLGFGPDEVATLLQSRAVKGGTR